MAFCEDHGEEVKEYFEAKTKKTKKKKKAKQRHGKLCKL